MSQIQKSFYITTPIYYVNDAPHLGHAYTTIAADVAARWHRMRGEQVWFITGTDEHGQKILRTAQNNNTTPQQWCDRLVEKSWKPLWEHLNISNNDFIRTTSENHQQKVQEFVQKLYDSGKIFKDTYSGFYCVGCEEYKLSADMVEIENPTSETSKYSCPTHKKPVEWIEESNYFFRLSQYQQQLLEIYENNPDFISPKSAKSEVINFVSQGLQDLSISRSSFDWGIKVPWDEKQVIYVWVDALLNYLTATSGDENLFPANIHLVGKDILRFHAVIWPALLLAAELPLPKKIVANGWLLVGGEKMSKSTLTGIAPQDLTKTFGVDAYRYYFLRAIAFGSDGSFSWEDFHAKYSAELANGFGNLASRTIAMIEKYCESRIPEAKNITKLEENLSLLASEATHAAGKAIDKLEFHTATTNIFKIVDALNSYITTTEPWKIAKNPESKVSLHTVLHTCSATLKTIAVLYYPFMPDTCSKLWEALGFSNKIGNIEEQNIDNIASNKSPIAGSVVHKIPSLFPRIDLGEKEK